MQNFIRRRSRRVVAAAMLAALPSVSPAATFIWSGGDALHGYFSAGDNWAGNSPPPTSGADLIFAATNAQNSAPFAETAYSVNSINFSTGAYAFSGNQQIEANLLTIGVGGIIDLASNLETISNPIVLSASQTWTVSGGNFNTTGSVNLGNNSLTAYVPSGSMSFNGALTSSSATASFGKTGAGLLTINAGSTSDSVGVISLAQGTTNLSGGTVITTQGSGNSYVDANPGNTATLNITGAGSYLNASTSPFYISNGTGHSGTVNITSSGELISSSINLPGSGGAGVLNVLSGGTVQTSLFNLGPTTASGATGNIVISGSGSSITATNFGLGAGTGTSGTLTINNSGGLVVSNVTGFGTGSFSINVSGGSYSTGALNSLSPTGGQINLNNGNLNTGLTIQAGASIVGDYFGGLSGSGIVVKLGASEQIIDASATVSGLTVSGGIFQISTGTFKVTNTIAPLIVNGNGSLNVTTVGTLDASANTGGDYIDGSGTGPTMTVSGSGAVFKGGSSLYVGYNTGDTGNLNVTSSGNVSVGSLNVPNNGKGIVTVSNSGLITTNQFTLGNGQANSVTLSSNGTLNVSGTSYFFDTTSSLIDNGGSFVTGSLSSSGLASTGRIGLNAGPSAGPALVINGTSGTNTYSGSITGPLPTGTAGSLLKTGASTQILSGFLNYNGGLTVNGGTLAVTGTAVGNSVGYLSVQSGALNISSGLMSVFGPQPLNVSGGMLNVNSGAALTVNSAQFVQIDGATNSPTINVTGSGTVFNASSLSVNVAVTAGNSGVLNVNSGAVFDANVLAVPGLGGNGTLNVSSGGIVNCGALYLDFGSQAGSCVAILSGAGSQINTNSLTLSSSNNPGSLTIANNAVLNIPSVLTFTTSAFPINVSGGSLTAGGLSSQGSGVSGAVNLLSNPTIGAALTLNGSTGTYGYSGSFSGSATLSKTGAYTQIYTGTGTLGQLAVSGGTFNISAGSLTLNNTIVGLAVTQGANLNVTGGAILNANAALLNNEVDLATMTVSGTGTRFLAGTEFDIGINLGTSTFNISGGAQMSTDTLDVPYNGTAIATITTGAQVSTGTLNVGNNGASVLTVSAGGTLLVSNNSSFGDTASNVNVSGGTFTTGGLVSLSGKGLIALTDPSGGTALTVNAASGVNSFSGNLSGSGTLLKTGGSTQVLLNGNSSIGTLTVQAGALNVSSGILALTRASSNPLNVTGGLLTINSGASVTVANSTASIGGAGTANVTVSGSGSKLNTPVGIFLGNTGLATLTATQQGSVISGNLYLGGQSALVINSGGTVTGGYDGVADASGTATTVTVDGQSSAYSDAVMHVGGYGATGGTGTVTITNLAAVTTKIDTSFESNNATINVSGGTLTTGALNSLGSGNGTILLADPALAPALTLNDAIATDTYTYSGSISGTGSLNKNGAYTQVLSGNNSFTGDISVNAGLLTLNNSSASLYQVTNGTLNFSTAGYPVGTAPVYVENGGILTGIAYFGNTPVNLFPGGTFLPGQYNFSFTAITGASSLIQPAFNTLSNTSALITLNAPTTINTPTGSSFKLITPLNTNNNAITKIGAGNVFVPAFKSNALNVSSGVMVINTPTSTGPLILGTLSISSSARLDIYESPVDITSTSLAVINSYVASGFNNGAWSGNGISGFGAASDSTHLTAIGVIQNNQSGTALFTASHQFEGITPGAGDVLVKYTYYGDANLDGKVDGSDYSRIDAAYLADQTNPTAVTGWYNGDFNYDGVINGSDYTLIDNAFNTQGALLAATLASPTAVATDQIATTAAVPEPTSLALLAIAATGILSRRKTVAESDNARCRRHI